MKDLTKRQAEALLAVEKLMKSDADITAREALVKLKISPSVYYSAKRKTEKKQKEPKAKRPYKRKDLYQAIPVESPKSKNVVMVMGSVDDIRAFLRDQI